MEISARTILVIGLIAILSMTGYMVIYKSDFFSDKPESFVYENAIKQYPVFEQESAATGPELIQIAKEIEQATTTMKDAPQTLAYARYLVVRAYVKAAMGNWSDTQSLNKALETASTIIGDEGGYPDIRSYTVALVDMLLYPPTPTEAKSTVMNHPFFSKFGQDTDGSANAFRINLLSHGNTLYRMTDIKYRLAILETQRLASIKRVSPAMPATWENVRGLLADAESSLARDRAGEMPFKNKSYLVESLYARAQFASLYLKVTGEKPLGEIEPLYTEALELAKIDMPQLTPYIENSWLEYKNNRKIR